METQKTQAETLILGKLVTMQGMVGNLIKVFTPPITSNLAQDKLSLAVINLNLTKIRGIALDLIRDTDFYFQENYRGIWEKPEGQNQATP